MNRVKEVIARVGGAQKIADMCEVSVRAVYKWIDTQVPAERAIEIEQKTGRAITIYDLRPDLKFDVETAA